MISEELITALKINGSFPTTNDLFSDSDFLVLFNQQMMVDILPLMMKLSEDYFLLTKDYTISTAGDSYLLPSRAIGSKIRDLQIVDGSGNLSSLVRLFEEDRPLNNSGFYLKRNSIELSSGYTTGTLRLTYFARPNKLVLSTECAEITSIDTLNNQVTCSSIPTSFATGTLCDLVQAINPYDLLASDSEILGISGTTITFSSLPDYLAVGDWVSLATESPVPMVPEEMHHILVQSALVKALSSKKDSAFDREDKMLKEMKQDAILMLDPRVENDSQSFKSGNLLNYITSRVY
jgi:hypothetical protein